MTGAGRGIGEGIALVLGREGANVVLTARKMGEIAAVGEAVSFLASDRAAMITGQMLAVGGGMLTGFGQDLRAVVRKRTESMKAGGKH